MPEIVALLQVIAPLISKTALRQMSHVVYGLLVTTRRITMLEISRWTESGGSYRTLQRWYHTGVPWVQVMWLFFTQRLWHAGHDYIAAGDEVVVGKAGHETYGLGRFFSSLQQRVIPSVSFFAFSLIDVQERQSYPLHITQIIKEKPEPPKPGQALKAKPEKRRAGRPKGSKNKLGNPPRLSPELVRIQPMLQAFLSLLTGVVRVSYLALDGHFGNYPSAWMVMQTGVHLISKLRHDAALYEPFTGKYSGRGPRPKYGPKVEVRRLKKKYLQSDRVKDGFRTQIYQATLLNKEFAFPLNVVVILKTNLTTQAQAHVILFTTDLKLAAEKVIDFYSLRFQIEFNFRDAKQYWGLDDFMNVKEAAVTNAANLAFFMVNFSTSLLARFQRMNPEFGILDLKSHYRGRRYVAETLKLLPQKPDGILLAEIFDQIARLGMIHPACQPAPT
ncbi:MAG: transposase [Anaerolineae bacterium]|nr:transposase [Anaerolineae bacterium]